MTTAALTAHTRLAPDEGAAPGRRRVRVFGIAIGAAVLVHVLLGAVLFLHPAGFLASPGPPPPPAAQPVPIEIENDVGTASDQQVGGETGKQTAQGGAPTPHQQTAPPVPPPPPKSDAPELPKAPDGEVAPPQPQPTDSKDPHAKPVDLPKVTATLPDPSPTQPKTQDTPGPEIRLASDEDEGVSGGDAEEPAAADPKAHNRLPAYPLSAARQAQHGSVQMFAHVGPDGAVQTVVIANSSGSTSLDAAALRAVQRWKFKPAMAHGVAVASDVPVAFNFVLH